MGISGPNRTQVLVALGCEKSLLLVAMPGAPNSFLLLSSSFLLLVVRPGAPSSVLAPSSDALCS